MKFEKKKLSIGAETIVSFSAEGLVEGMAFQIVAKRQGIYFTGSSPVLENQSDLEELAKTIGAAWTEHRSLVPKLERV